MNKVSNITQTVTFKPSLINMKVPKYVRKPVSTSSHQQQQSGLLTQGRWTPWIHEVDSRLWLYTCSLSRNPQSSNQAPCFSLQLSSVGESVSLQPHISVPGWQEWNLTCLKVVVHSDASLFSSVVKSDYLSYCRLSVSRTIVLWHVSSTHSCCSLDAF